jgi:recombinational DNA repair ATPase RecF
MIRVTKIEIVEFRGIREMSLDLGCNNFAVCGPNGTGKSGIVDALEFGLTGNITRLTGAGTGLLSIKEHAPHVDSAKSPEKASVTLHLEIPHLKKTATITRTVAKPRAPVVVPNQPDICAVLEEVEKHPEFALSRRQIIKYILAEPTKRATDVQELLRLEEISKLRSVFTKIANDAGRQVRPAEANLNAARNELQTALDVTALTPELVLTAVNQRRRLLGLTDLPVFEATTSIKDGLSSRREDTEGRVGKAAALASLQALDTQFSRLKSQAFSDHCNALEARCSALSGDRSVLNAVTRSELLQKAIEQFDGEHCPVCETDWDEVDFRRHIESKLAQYRVAREKRDEIEKQLIPVGQLMAAVCSSLSAVARLGSQFEPTVDVSELLLFEKKLETAQEQFAKVMPLEDTASALKDLLVRATVEEAVTSVRKGVDAIPEPTEKDAALSYLIDGQAKLDTYRNYRRAHRAATDKDKTAKAVLAKYETVTTTALEGIYKAVEAQFQELYRAINRDDESAFTAELKPSLGKLGFDVDFYGRGKFPPGAYHSEGHQDAMGLCLYLALMKHLLDDDFTFAVLDDVLMSVDAGHRREVCTLLSTVFPNTQFILTTHDRVWLEHMRGQGLVKDGCFRHFRKWTVDCGPMNWDAKDVWQEIVDDLARNETSAAAAALRNYLEYAASEMAQRLRAHVEYRADAQHSLGDLLGPALGAYAKWLKAAKNAAASWGKKEEVAVIEKMEAEFVTLRTATQADQWELNSATHYNEWARLDPKDLEPLVDAFEQLMVAVNCNICGAGQYVTPKVGRAEGLRCRCGAVNLSLLAK